jgi:hypothetical protein
MSTIRLPWET